LPYRYVNLTEVGFGEFFWPFSLYFIFSGSKRKRKRDPDPLPLSEQDSPEELLGNYR
jgi:hypothetical protein